MLKKFLQKALIKIEYLSKMTIMNQNGNPIDSDGNSKSKNDPLQNGRCGSHCTSKKDEGIVVYWNIEFTHVSKKEEHQYDNIFDEIKAHFQQLIHIEKGENIK